MKPRQAHALPESPPWRWAVGGALAGLLITGGVLAPARWTASLVQGLSESRLTLPDARGTVWNGSAQLMLTGGPGSRDRLALPGRVHWRWHLDGRGLGLSLRADCCMPEPTRISLRPHAGGLDLQMGALRSQWPAGLLAGLGAPWNTLQPQGTLTLESPGLQLAVLGWNAAHSRWQLQGQAALTAQAMASRLSPLRPMGSYRVDLQGHGASRPPSIELRTLEGALQLSGQGQWVDQRLRFAGEASAAPDQEAALANLLNVIGRRQGTRSLLSLG